MKNGVVLCVPDVHVPFHHRPAWEAVLEIIDVTQPNVALQGGDFGDQHAFNRHGKEFGRKRDAEAELEACQHEWARFELAASESEIVFLTGNHDTNAARTAASTAPSLEMFVPGPEGLYDMDSRVQVVPYQVEHQIGRVRYFHDAGFAGVHAAHQTLAAVNHNCVMFHTHRGTIVYSGDTSGKQRFCLNAGYLGDEKHMTYVPPSKRRQWQLGFGVVTYVDGIAFAQFIPWVGKFFYAGRVWK